MPSTVLLSPTTHPLQRLTLTRVQLDQEQPTCMLQTQGEELCLYSLVGTVILTEDERSVPLGARRAVVDLSVSVARFPAGAPRQLQLELQDFSADLLLVSAPASPPIEAAPCIHHHDVLAHTVGTGTHQREVRDVPTPAGYTIACGETLNIPGGVSSWPPHATSADLAKFRTGVTTWEEMFFCVCPSPGVAVLDGYYADGTSAQEIIRLHNGAAYCMPLGSHMCYAAPDSYLWYFWAYTGTALQKAYRKFADDVAIYRK